MTTTTSSNKPQYTGHLRRGSDPDTVVGVIQDEWGWKITLVGTRHPSGGYILAGTLGDTPKFQRIAALGELDESTLPES
jgi:hypothetical protein